MSDQNETYVREQWARVVSRARDDMDAWEINFGGPWFDNVFENQDVAWLAARQFTEERLEAIRQLEEEIEELRDEWIEAWDELRSCIRLNANEYASEEAQRICRLTRILARLQAALTDLQRGLKPGGKA